MPYLIIPLGVACLSGISLNKPNVSEIFYGNFPSNKLSVSENVCDKISSNKPSSSDIEKLSHDMGMLYKENTFGLRNWVRGFAFDQIGHESYRGYTFVRLVWVATDVGAFIEELLNILSFIRSWHLIFPSNAHALSEF